MDDISSDISTDSTLASVGDPGSSFSCLLKCQLSPLQKQKAQKKMEFLTEVEEGTNSLRELKAAHAETIQELQKTRKILNMESKICKDYKVESFNCTSTQCSVHVSNTRSYLSN